MRNAIISIRGTDVKKVNYNNNFTAKPGEKMDIQVKTNVAVKLNVQAPTNAVVIIRFEAKDANDCLAFEMETITAVSSSTYVDDFENVIKNEYLPTVMLSVNEKVRAVSAVIGLNVSTPPISFGKTNESKDDDDNVVAFDFDRKK